MTHYQKLIKALKSKKYKFEVGHIENGDLGEADDESVRIDTLNLLTDILVHEITHMIYPKWSEGKVEKKSNRVYNRLTIAQRQKLLFLFVKRLTRKDGCIYRYYGG